MAMLLRASIHLCKNSIKIRVQPMLLNHVVDMELI